MASLVGIFPCFAGDLDGLNSGIGLPGFPKLQIPGSFLDLSVAVSHFLIGLTLDFLAVTELCVSQWKRRK